MAELNIWSLEDQERYAVDQVRRMKEREMLTSCLEFRLGLPDKFIKGLFSEEDDWAFMVKLSVLCEAAVTHALVENVGAEGQNSVWYDHFSNLQNGKRLVLAERLGLFSREVRDKLDAIAQIRNSFAHEVKNLGGSLTKFFRDCREEKKLELSNKLLGIKHSKGQPWGFYEGNFRLVIGVGAMAAIKALAEISLDDAAILELEAHWRAAGMIN